METCPLASTSTDQQRAGAVSGARSQALGAARCDYCGDAAGTGITETVAVGQGPVFSRVVAACAFCARLRVQGLGHDSSWVLTWENGGETEP